MEAPFFRDFFGGNQSFLDKQGQGNFDEQAGGKLGHGEFQIRQRHLLNMQVLQNQQRADQLAHHYNHNHHVHHNHQHDHSIMQMQQPISTPMEVTGASYPSMPYYGNSMPVVETNSEFTPVGVGDHITPISLRNPSYESSGALNGFSVSHGFSNTFQPEHYQVANNLQAERLLSSLSKRHGQLPQPHMTNDYAFSRTSGDAHTLHTASNLEESWYHGLSKESCKSFSSSNTMQYEAMGGGGRQQIAYKKHSITANMEQSAWPVYLNQDANNAQRSNYVHQTAVSIVPRSLGIRKQQFSKYGSYEQDQLSRYSGQISDIGIVNAGSKVQSSCQNWNPGQSYQSSEKLAGLQACTPLYSSGQLGLTNAIDPNWQQLAEPNGDNLKCSQQTQSESNEHRTHNKATARDGSHTHLSNSMEYESYGNANTKRQSYVHMLFDDLKEGEEESNLPQEIDAMSGQNAGGLQVKDGSLPLAIPQSWVLTRSVTNAHFPGKLDTGSLYQPSQESRLNSIKAESNERQSREFSSVASPSLPPQWQLHSTGDSSEPESSRCAGVRMLDAGVVDNPKETCRPFHSSLEKLIFPSYDGVVNFIPNADVNLVKSSRTCEFPAAQLPALESKGVPFRSSSNSLHSRGRIRGNETLEQANGALSKPSAIIVSPNVSYVGKLPSTAGASLASHLSPQSFGLRLAPPTPSQSLQHIVTRKVSDEMVSSQVRSSSRESAIGVNGGVAQVDMIERSQSCLRDSMAHSAPQRVGEGDNVAGFPFLVPRARMQMEHPLLPSNYGQHRYPSAGYADLRMPSPSGFMVSPQSSSSQVNTALIECQTVKAGLARENSFVAYSGAPPTHSHGHMIIHPTRTEHNPSDIQTRDNALFPMKAIQSDASLVLKGDSRSSHSFGQANRVSQMSQRLLNMFSLNSKGEVYQGASRLGEKLYDTSQSICNQPEEMDLEASFNHGGEFPINSNSKMHMGNPGSPGKLFVSSTQRLSNQKKQVGQDGGVVQPVNSNPNVFEASFSAQIMSYPKVTPMSIPEFQQPKALFTPKPPSNGNTRGDAQNREDLSLKDLSMDRSSERLLHPDATSMEDEHVPFVSRPDSLRHMQLNEKAIRKSFDLRTNSEEGMPRLATMAASRNSSKQTNSGNILQYERASKTLVSDNTGENTHKGLVSVELTKSCEDQELLNRFHDSMQSLPSGEKSGGSGELVVAGAELLVAPSNNADSSGSHLQTGHNLGIPCRKKRKRMNLPYVPWHLAIKQPRGHLLSTRSLESKWAEATNRLPEKHDGEAECYASNAHNASRAVARLKLTTLVMQRIVPFLPISLMQGSQGADYESITYSVAKICLEETCKLVSHAQMHAKDHQQTQFHAVSMIAEVHSNGYGPKEYPLTRLSRRFTENMKQLSSELERLENAISTLELRHEVQELDMLAIVNRLIKYQGGNFLSDSVHSCTKNSRGLHYDSVRTRFTERYVTAWPMPRILPEIASCLSL